MRDGKPAQPHTTHAEDPGSQLFGTPSFGCPATLPPSVTEVSSLREGRHLAVQRGRPLGRKLRGTQRGKRHRACQGGLHLHLGALVEKRRPPGLQDFCKRLQLSKEVLKDGSGISFSLASNERIFQSKERMKMLRDGRAQVSYLENCRLTQTLLA